MNKKGKCIIFSAPSGAGKTTIVKHLINHRNDLEFSISACSRNKRENEVNGKDYYFLGIDEFKKKIEQNAFIEWEEVYKNHFYGTLKSEISRIWNVNKNVIFDVDVIGGLNIKKIFGHNAISIFVKPPSYEILEQRLKKRKTETKETLKKRLSKATQEMKMENKFDFILINDDLKTACTIANEKINNFLNRK